MKTHISIAFYGTAKPIHQEAETLEQAYEAMRHRIHCPEIKTQLQSLWKDYQRQQQAGIGIASACSQLGGVAVTIADYPRDPWLDSLTQTMPETERVTYSPQTTTAL
jgi:hypothetical protein